MCHVSFKKKLKKIATVEEVAEHLTREALPDAPIFSCSSSSYHDGPSLRMLKKWAKEHGEYPLTTRNRKRRRS